MTHLNLTCSQSFLSPGSMAFIATVGGWSSESGTETKKIEPQSNSMTGRTDETVLVTIAMTEKRMLNESFVE